MSTPTFQEKLAELKPYEYTEDNTKANMLIYGRSGTGKTHTVSTAPGPILIHSFDSGGTRTISALRKQGAIPESKQIILDTRYEAEISRKKSSLDKTSPNMGESGPFAYRLWEKEFNELLAAGVFNKLGTYVIDSCTGWMEAMMNEITAQEKRKFGESQIQDYKKLGYFVTDTLKEILDIPCNFIMTGHLDSYKDESDGKTYFSLVTVGQKQKVSVPNNFDEVYYLAVKEEGGKIRRELLTEISGKHEAKTRIGAGKFLPREEPNISNLLKKAGLPYQDKPALG